MILYLIACWRAKRYCNRANFTRRTAFLAELKPFANGYKDRMAYPEAWLYIKNFDVDRAMTWAAHKEKMIKEGDETL